MGDNLPEWVEIRSTPLSNDPLCPFLTRGAVRDPVGAIGTRSPSADRRNGRTTRSLPARNPEHRNRRCTASSVHRRTRRLAVDPRPLGGDELPDIPAALRRTDRRGCSQATSADRVIARLPQLHQQRRHRERRKFRRHRAALRRHLQLLRHNPIRGGESIRRIQIRIVQNTRRGARRRSLPPANSSHST